MESPSPQPPSQQPPIAQIPAVVAVPVPVVPATEGAFCYIAVKSSLYAEDCAVFGLNNDEIRALSNRYSYGSTQIANGVLIKTHAIALMNSLSQLGYKVICSTGETEIVWTMAREI